MKYIYAGYSKSGTKSVALAFKKLGYKVCDFEETMLFHAKQWIEICTSTTTKERQYQLLYEMYKEFDVVCDAPGYFFWQEIMEVFPEAKCLFYQRSDEDTWFVSMKKQYEEMSIMSPLPDFPMWLIRVIFNPTMNLWGEFGDKCMQLLFNDLGRPRRTWNFKWMKLNEMTLRMNYRKHNSHFLATCPTEKRLVLDKLGDWKPICDFTGDTIPDFEFPHTNKGGSITAEILDGKAARKDEEINVQKVVTQEIKRRVVLVTCICVTAYYLFFNFLQ